METIESVVPPGRIKFIAECSLALPHSRGHDGPEHSIYCGCPVGRRIIRSQEECSAMMNRIVGIGTLFVIAFVVMFGIVFKDMFVWMWNNPDKIW